MEVRSAATGVEVGPPSRRSVALDTPIWIDFEVVPPKRVWHSPSHQLDRALELEYHAKGLWGESLSYHHQ